MRSGAYPKTYREDFDGISDDHLAGGLGSTSWAVSDGSRTAGDGVD